MTRDDHIRMNLFYRSHPWHGVPMGDNAPEVLTSYIEIVPTDAMKYELDKETGILKVDRPQKYSNICPALYGLIPQTYCGKKVGELCGQKLGKKGIIGDGDPLDICILSEKRIERGDILVDAIPIGGFRTVDKMEADDKIIAVLKGDLVYGQIQTIQQCPPNLIERLRHYFLTYKDCPGESNERHMDIKAVYGREEAHEVIEAATQDYRETFPEIWSQYQHLRGTK